jgi:hypothetical protein
MKYFNIQHLPTGAYLHYSNGSYKLLTAKKGAAQFSEAKAASMIDELTASYPGDFEAIEETENQTNATTQNSN